MTVSQSTYEYFYVPKRKLIVTKQSDRPISTSENTRPPSQVRLNFVSSSILGRTLAPRSELDRSYGGKLVCL